MLQKPPKRQRGLVLTPQGLNKLRDAIWQWELQENFGDRYTLDALGRRVSLDPVTVAKVLNAEKGVDKRTLELCFQAFDLKLEPIDITRPVSYLLPEKAFDPLTELYTAHQDWGEAVDVSHFCGRREELAQLKHWILQEHCRLVGLFGMGGIGKTTLSVKLAQHIKDHFDYVIWKSLRNAPPIQEVLIHLIQFLTDGHVSETILPQSVEEKVSCLIRYLRNHRCLRRAGQCRRLAGKRCSRWLLSRRCIGIWSLAATVG